MIQEISEDFQKTSKNLPRNLLEYHACENEIMSCPEGFWLKGLKRAGTKSTLFLFLVHSY